MRTPNYYQGVFTPQNPKKWINVEKGIPIIFRSSFERKFMGWCDLTEAVLKVGSETLIIPYINPLKKRVCRYITDFYMEVKEKNGKVVKYVIEVKPEGQTKRPQKTKGKRASSLLFEGATYIQNLAKWTSAEQYCKSRGIVFKIVTEKDLMG